MFKNLLIIASVALLLLTGCGNQMNKDKEEQIKKRSIEAAVKVLKVEDHLEVVVEKAELSDPQSAPAVLVNVHEKGDPKKKYVVSVNYENNYEVTGISY